MAGPVLDAASGLRGGEELRRFGAALPSVDESRALVWAAVYALRAEGVPRTRAFRIGSRRAAVSWMFREGWSAREIAADRGCGVRTVEDDLNAMRRVIARGGVRRLSECSLPRLREW